MSDLSRETGTERQRAQETQEKTESESETCMRNMGTVSETFGGTQIDRENQRMSMRIELGQI